MDNNMNNMNMRQNQMQVPNAQYFMHGGYAQGESMHSGIQGMGPGGGLNQSPSHMQHHQQMGGGGGGGGHMQQQQMGSNAPQQQGHSIQHMGPSSGPQHSHANPQQHSAHPPPPPSSMLAIANPNPHKEINIVGLSRLGQETVQDITSRFQEIFAALKIIQPTANRDNNTEKKVQEYFRTIRLLFKRVRIIYEKCNDGYPQGMEYTHVESLIPYKEDPEHRTDPMQCEEYRKAMQENQELIETVKLKNRQLREIIDRTRIIIWEINTMLTMRRS